MHLWTSNNSWRDSNTNFFKFKHLWFRLGSEWSNFKVVWNAIMSKAKPSLKIGTANAICWNSLGLFRDYSLNYIFFRNKTFLFFKIESWNFQHLFEKKISWNLTQFQLNQTRDRKNGNKNCLNELNELKFCEVSRNCFSNRCWKFQLSILKNKKVLSLKNI